MISEHSAHSTPQPFGIRTCLWRYTCLLLLILMLWHRQAKFESKGDKLSSSAEGRIRTYQSLRHQIASRLNARWQTDWAIEDQAKNLNSTARPYDQRAFSPLVTARFVTRFNLWLRHDLWPHNASICDPARFVTKSASICDQRYTMILESNLCRGKLVFVFTLIMYTKLYNMMIYIWLMI